MVVHHYHIGLRRAPPGAEEKAAIEMGTLEAGAQVRPRANLVPYLCGWGGREIAQGTISGVPGPFGNAEQLVQLVLLEQGALARDCLMHPGQAEIVAPALEEREGGRVLLLGQSATKQWKILPDQLLLQVDRVGAHYGALAVGPGPGERRHQIGKGLSHSGARFQQLNSTVVIGIRDEGSHVALTLTVFVA